MEKYIKQDDFSHEFRTELINKDFKGIRKVPKKDGWYWVVNLDTVDLNEIRLGVDSNEKEKFISMINIIKCEDFNEFYALVTDEVQLTPKRYSVTGDIVNKYVPYEKNYISFDFLDNHNRKQAFTLFVNKNTKIATQDGKELDWQEIENSRVSARIQCKFSKKTARISLIAEEVLILGQCSREVEYANLCEKYETYMEQSTLTITVDKPRIALISGDNHGRADFCGSIYKNLCDIITIDTNMSDIADIVAKVQDINHKGNIDIICIVRGGGDPEDMCIYNSPELVEAIIHSEIPVVTGIGHKNDELMAEKVAFGNYTPTAAATYIQRLINKRRFKDKDKHTKESYNELAEEYSKLLEEHTTLQARYEHLQEEVNKSKKGFLARLCGF